MQEAPLLQMLFACGCFLTMRFDRCGIVHVVSNYKIQFELRFYREEFQICQFIESAVQLPDRTGRIDETLEKVSAFNASNFGFKCAFDANRNVVQLNTSIKSGTLYEQKWLLKQTIPRLEAAAKALRQPCRTPLINECAPSFPAKVNWLTDVVQGRVRTLCDYGLSRRCLNTHKRWQVAADPQTSRYRVQYQVGRMTSKSNRSRMLAKINELNRLLPAKLFERNGVVFAAVEFFCPSFIDFQSRLDEAVHHCLHASSVFEHPHSYGFPL